jgi:hypothetical protein
MAIEWTKTEYGNTVDRTEILLTVNATALDLICTRSGVDIECLETLGINLVSALLFDDGTYLEFADSTCMGIDQ